MNIEKIKKLTDQELKSKLDSFVDKSGSLVLSTESAPYIIENAKRLLGKNSFSESYEHYSI